MQLIKLKNKFTLINRIKYFLGFRTKLSYEERISWFIQNYYETGMEYSILVETMKDTNLDNFIWYKDKISIPKYIDELK